MTCRSCEYRTVPCQKFLLFSGGAATYKLDPTKLGDNDAIATTTVAGRIAGRARDLISIHIADDQGDVVVKAVGQTWASFHTIEDTPQRMHLPFQAFKPFTIEFTGFMVSPTAKHITFLVEIDPLPVGETCECGREHGR